MNTIIFFLVQIFLTLIVVTLITAYLRPYLKKVLTDLCGTDERAQFWTAFSNILLIGLPLIFALNYRPEFRDTEDLFFDVAAKLSGNLGGLLLALVCIGIIISFFAVTAPRQPKAESK